MKSKFHWGHGIFIFYTCFVATVVFVLIASRSVDRSLVLDDYYALDLTYQQRIDKMNNETESNSLQIISEADRSEIVISFQDKNDLRGKIHFYRPSNQNLDKVFEIQDPVMVFDKEGFAPGAWKVKVDWENDGNKFYKVQDLFI
jgi:hypothetical protein